MKRAALLVLLGTVLLGNASALTPEQATRNYGRDVLKAYAAQGMKLAPGRAALLSCQKVVPEVPDTVEDCRLHLWGAQAVAEVIYRASDDVTGMRQLWVGKMSGLPSDERMRQLVRALADDFNQWTKTPAAQQWFKQAAVTQGPRRFGFDVPCAVFSRQRLPVGVLSCRQGPGPADGPTIMVNLADGRSFSAGVR